MCAHAHVHVHACSCASIHFLIPARRGGWEWEDKPVLVEIHAQTYSTKSEASLNY